MSAGSGVYARMLEVVGREAGDLYEEMPGRPVATSGEPVEIRQHLRERYDFRSPLDAGELVQDVAKLLRRWSVQVTHPRYFGLFNPTPRPITAAADALAALFNPQLAVWDHAPAANEIEAHVLRFLADAVGYDPDGCHAAFTSGGQEANHTAVVAALAHAYPAVTRHGLRSLRRDPVLYLSRRGHHSIEKAASATGLGHRAIRRVGVDDRLRLDPAELRGRIRRDREAGRAPFLVVATAGTTGVGAVDPLDAVASVCRDEGLWLHVDAAWAGSALLSRRLRPELAGIEAADSVTWDAHKWLWAPVGTGMFFTRHRAVVERAFSLDADYVPPGTEGTSDRMTTTLQWSRRFAGLRVFLTLAELGAEGVERLVDHQVVMGAELRGRLRERGWTVVNRTRLPLVCFTHPSIEEGRLAAGDVARWVCASGRAWISSLALGDRSVLRACVTSYRTGADDLEILLDTLDQALEEAAGHRG